jgi:DNA invertase Pin-like site-specific DNA recombinase
LEVR